MFSGNDHAATTPLHAPSLLAALIFSLFAPTLHATGAEASQCEPGDARSRVEIQDANGRYGSKVQITVDEVTERTPVNVRVVTEICEEREGVLRWTPISDPASTTLSRRSGRVALARVRRVAQSGIWAFEAKNPMHPPYALQSSTSAETVVELRGSCDQKAEIFARFIPSNPESSEPTPETFGDYFLESAHLTIVCPEIPTPPAVRVCGDGITQIDMGEICDDGNDINDDACDNYCNYNVQCRPRPGPTPTPSPFCGDGKLGQNETCEEPGDLVPPIFDPNSTPDRVCRGDCTYCGDDIVNGPKNSSGQFVEKCDDGNDIDDGYDGNCRNDCTRCGDGIINGPKDAEGKFIEQCDDGSQNGTSASTCTDYCTECIYVGWFRDPKFRPDGSVTGNGRMEVVDALRPVPNPDSFPEIDASQTRFTFKARFGSESFTAPAWGVGTDKPLTYFSDSGNEGYAWNKGSGTDSFVLKARSGFASVNYDIPDMGTGPFVADFLASSEERISAVVDLRMDNVEDGSCVIARSNVWCRRSGGTSLNCPLQ
jgi:hypothetical protein